MDEHTTKYAKTHQLGSFMLNFHLAFGASGAWVVRGESLLGYIIGGANPYAHMLPIEQLFQSIQDLYHQCGKLRPYITIGRPPKQIEDSVPSFNGLNHVRPKSIETSSITLFDPYLFSRHHLRSSDQIESESTRSCESGEKKASVKKKPIRPRHNLANGPN